MGLFSGSKTKDEGLPVKEPKSPNSLQRTPTMGPTNGSSSKGRVQITDPRESGLKSKRPQPLQRTVSVRTRYVDMLLAMDRIPRVDNILASFFTWILLAGFIVFPGTFTSIADVGNDTTQKLENKILHTVSHLPLLWVAGACCVVGVVGMLALWIKWGKNYVWLLNKIFLPGLLNSIAGLISTVVNVYTARHGNFSVTAKITAIVTGACSGVFLILFIVYNQIVLKKVRNSHDRDMQIDHHDESVGEKAKRLVHEPALEPESVV